MVDLPRYRSHKIVRAAKINAVAKIAEGKTQLILALPDDERAGLEVSEDYVAKHRPQVDGYYVIYEDGYESWSPAEAFEKGYTKVEDGPEKA